MPRRGGGRVSLPEVAKADRRATFCVIVSFPSKPGMRAEFGPVISLRDGDRQHE
jgi:hypothetical protein